MKMELPGSIRSFATAAGLIGGLAFGSICAAEASTVHHDAAIVSADIATAATRTDTVAAQQAEGLDVAIRDGSGAATALLLVGTGFYATRRTHH